MKRRLISSFLALGLCLSVLALPAAYGAEEPVYDVPDGWYSRTSFKIGGREVYRYNYNDEHPLIYDVETGVTFRDSAYISATDNIVWDASATCYVPADLLPRTWCGTDVAAWAKPAYERLTGIYVPVEERGAITRGKFASLLVRCLYAALPKGAIYVSEEVGQGFFADSDDILLRLAASCGIMVGSPDGDRRLSNWDKNITRQECATMVCAAVDFISRQGYPVSAAGEPAVYADSDTIAAWAAPFTARVASYGLMRGDENRNFKPFDNLDWPSAVVLANNLMDLADQAVTDSMGAIRIQSQLDADLWRASRNNMDYQIARPTTGRELYLHLFENSAGGLSSLLVNLELQTIYIEDYDENGVGTSVTELPLELSIFGTFLAGRDGNYYLAVGQLNEELDDDAVTFRIIKFNEAWERVAAVDYTGGETYTKQPFRTTIARMDLSPSGTLALYAARNRYDGHQSNITFLVDSADMTPTATWGERFPDNHVSHSFGQFVRYDGEDLVTVDHGDAYPRSFCLQKNPNPFTSKVTLLQLAGPTGQNVTHAIGSGFEVTGSGYLFLGCSAPQEDFDAEANTPWNLFLTFTDRELEDTTLTWLTQGTESISRARLVKLDEDRLIALWCTDAGVHYLPLDGAGTPIGEERFIPHAIGPTTDPVVRSDGTVCWLAIREAGTGGYAPEVYTLEP